ncbi:hypothetical protein J1614_010394 [Plenodomus biglobosus]|nr:hypothetical protein J1614_010394 [Plenodomus biglobosus]
MAYSWNHQILLPCVASSLKASNRSSVADSWRSFRLQTFGSDPVFPQSFFAATGCTSLSNKTEPSSWWEANQTEICMAFGHAVLDEFVMLMMKSHSLAGLVVADPALRGVLLMAQLAIDDIPTDSTCVRRHYAPDQPSRPFSQKHKFRYTSV